VLLLLAATAAAAAAAAAANTQGAIASQAVLHADALPQADDVREYIPESHETVSQSCRWCSLTQHNGAAGIMLAALHVHCSCMPGWQMHACMHANYFAS
jgi:hypothetical protein